MDDFLKALVKIDYSDRDAVMKLMDEYNLSEEDQLDVWDAIDIMLDTPKEDLGKKLADDPQNLDPINIDNIDALADAAKDMADEDKSDVKVTEVDKDEDGDSDKVTIEKEAPEKDGASDKEDNPHDQEMSEEKEPENSTNLLARHLGSLGRFE